MTDGKIEILGKRQVMLPKEVVSELERVSPKIEYNSLKKIFREGVKDYAKKIGSGEEGMFKNVTDIFETFGLGKMEVVKNDNKKKMCVIKVYDCPLVKEVGKSQILTAAMSGMFSFLFNKDVDAKQLTPKQKLDYYEFVIK